MSAASAPPGARVAVVGAGGIGFDVSEFLTTEHSRRRSTSTRGWPSGASATRRVPRRARRAAPDAESPREVYLLQRKASSIGRGLGKTTGWVHRAALQAKGVEQMTGVVSYDRIDDEGLHITVGEDAADPGARRRHVVVCAGQEPVRTVADALEARGLTVHLIGGADVAAELDAKRAIRQGTEVAARI